MLGCSTSLLAVLTIAACACGRVAAAELDSLVEGLASDDFKVRENSTAELKLRAQADPVAVRKLFLHHYTKNPDPEVRLRCRELLRVLMAESIGFLGLRHQPRDFVEGKKNLPAVEIVMVVENSPAAKAGVKVGDVVLEFDGKPLEREDISTAFSRSIRLIGAGRKTSLKIVRDGEAMILPITTGVAPSEVVNSDPETRFQEWLKMELERAARP